MTAPSGIVRASLACASMLGVSVLVLGTAGAAGGGGLFVLPVEPAWPVGEADAGVFGERLAIALGQTGRVRVLTARDVPEVWRRELPADLSACVTPACLARL